MSSPAANIANLLSAQSIGTLGTSLFVGRDAGGTTQTISIYESGGRAPHPSLARDYIDIQISVWGAVNDYDGGYTKAKEIKDYLLGLDAQTIGDDEYFAFNMRSNLAFVGYDGNNRPMFTSYYRIIIDSNINVGNRLTF